MKAGYGKTVRPVCAADGGQLSLGASSDPTGGGKAAKPARRRRAEREGVFGVMSMWRALR